MEQRMTSDKDIHSNSGKMNLILMIYSTCSLEVDYSITITKEDTTKLREDRNNKQIINQVKMRIQRKHLYSNLDL